MTGAEPLSLLYDHYGVATPRGPLYSGDRCSAPVMPLL